MIKHLMIGICLAMVLGCSPAEVVKSADWSRMETVRVTMAEFSFDPAALRFERDRPYKLEIVNAGEAKHYFAAPEFFKAIAARKVQSNTDGEIKATYFTAIEVNPGKSLDLYFVPMTVGKYELLCTIEGHAGKGMMGTIRIE